jgi:hypothetical protein
MLKVFETNNPLLMYESLFPIHTCTKQFLPSPVSNQPQLSWFNSLNHAFWKLQVDVFHSKCKKKKLESKCIVMHIINCYCEVYIRRTFCGEIIFLNDFHIILAVCNLVNLYQKLVLTNLWLKWRGNSRGRNYGWK